MPINILLAINKKRSSTFLSNTILGYFILQTIFNLKLNTNIKIAISIKQAFMLQIKILKLHLKCEKTKKYISINQA